MFVSIILFALSLSLSSISFDCLLLRPRAMCINFQNERLHRLPRYIGISSSYTGRGLAKNFSLLSSPRSVVSYVDLRNESPETICPNPYIPCVYYASACARGKNSPLSMNNTMNGSEIYFSETLLQFLRHERVQTQCIYVIAREGSV